MNDVLHELGRRWVVVMESDFGDLDEAVSGLGKATCGGDETESR